MVKFKGPEKQFSKSASCYEECGPINTFQLKVQQLCPFHMRDFYIFFCLWADLFGLKHFSWKNVPISNIIFSFLTEIQLSMITSILL